MRLLFLLTVVVGTLAAEDAFSTFAKKFGKQYRSTEELNMRRAVFEERYYKMLDHNKRYKAGLETWSQKEHTDMDLTPEEWMSEQIGLPVNTTEFKESTNEEIEALLNGPRKTPREFSWVTQGAVSSIKDQAKCGSSVFAAIGAIESCSKIVTGVLSDDLSEQHLLDCWFSDSMISPPKGCDRFWPNDYLGFLTYREPHNQEESAYPYISGTTGKITACEPDPSGYNTNFEVAETYNSLYTFEGSMEVLLAKNPIITGVQLTDNWLLYDHGVMDNEQCCNDGDDIDCTYRVNHIVLVVGYGYDFDSGLDYWLIKKSWGTGWGEAGFIRLKKGTGHCGIGTFFQTYPICKAT